MTWTLLRNAAYTRHRMLWYISGADSATWHLHAAIIAAVYGW